MKFEFGAHAKDVITGFSGCVIGHTHYITGCDQYLLSPPVKSGSEWVESRWFDVDRLELLADTAPIVLGQATSNGPDKPAPIK